MNHDPDGDEMIYKNEEMKVFGDDMCAELY